jgi:two-component system sensor histidine kinase QseC
MEVLLITGAFLAIGLVILTRISVRRGLRPLVDLKQQAGALTARNLSARLESKGPVAEISSLAIVLNNLLSRIEESFERERRMTANFAHELRTPLAELQIASDLALKWPDDQEAQENMRTTCLHVSKRMNGIVSRLLQLARLESHKDVVVEESIELQAVVKSEWQERAVIVEKRGLALHQEGAVRIESNMGLLRLLLGVLLENAMLHGAPNTTIRATASMHDGGALLQLSNEASDLKAMNLESLTERFSRQDEARTSSEHLGLGLTLAGTVAQHLGVTLTFSASNSRFVVSLDFGPSSI